MPGLLGAYTLLQEDVELSCSNVTNVVIARANKNFLLR